MVQSKAAVYVLNDQRVTPARNAALHVLRNRVVPRLLVDVRDELALERLGVDLNVRARPSVREDDERRVDDAARALVDAAGRFTVPQHP